MKTFLVTGATGFIGSHLVRRLRDHGHHVRCLVRECSDTSSLEDCGCECYIGNLLDLESCKNAMIGVDVVIHLAGITHAIDPEVMMKVNATASGVVAEACANVASSPRLVYVSSLAAAGPAARRSEVRKEVDPCSPVSLYGHSKRSGEEEVSRFADCVPVTILRPGIVYGNGDRNMAELMKPIYRMRLHIVIGFSTPPLSLVHVDDLVSAIVSASENGEIVDAAKLDSGQGVYHICDDREFPTYAQLGKMLGAAMHKSVLVWPLWRWVGRCIGMGSQWFARVTKRSTVLTLDKVREGTVPSWATSAAKARQQLGFDPNESLRKRLEPTARWYIENKWI